MPLVKRNPPLTIKVRCFLKGHAWVKSKSHPGFHTCMRCRQRVAAPETWVEANGAARGSDEFDEPATDGPSHKE